MIVATQYVKIAEVDELEMLEDCAIQVFKYYDFLDNKLRYGDMITSGGVRAFEDRRHRGSTSLLREFIDYVKTNSGGGKALLVGPFTDAELELLWRENVPVGDYKYNILPMEPVVELSTADSITKNIKVFIESAEKVIGKFGVKSDLLLCAQQIGGKVRGELAKCNRHSNYMI